MSQDIVELIEPYRASDSSRWAKLASNVQWRRLVLLLLREIVVELRALVSEARALRPDAGALRPDARALRPETSALNANHRTDPEQ